MSLFPNPELADSEGLVKVGGELKPALVLEAYRRGIFPWYNDGYPVLWWSPDPRAIFDLDRFHVPHRLARTIRSGKFQATINRAFSQVICGCADRDSTWITQEMIQAYEELHRLGFAHSLEVWREGELAGGIYGVAIGGMFAGESMFARLTDASKAALVFLVEHLRGRGYKLFDIQMVTAHTRQFQPVEISRKEYLRRLRQAGKRQITFMD